MIAALAKEKDKSVSKLSYMDPPIAPEPEPRQPPVKSRPAKLVIPPPISPPTSPSSASSEEMEVIAVLNCFSSY
jgi:hypothetical protein